MSKRAEEAAMKAYPHPDFNAFRDTETAIRANSEMGNCRKYYIEGYEQAEKDMKEKFIQFVHQHYPINYVGWITDFQRYMDKEQ